MGLFDRIFGRAPKPIGQPVGQFKLFTGYEPVWPGRGGNIYEMQMIRAAINAAATHISKLQPTIQGTAKRTGRPRSSTSTTRPILCLSTTNTAR